MILFDSENEYYIQLEVQKLWLSYLSKTLSIYKSGEVMGSFLSKADTTLIQIYHLQ